MKTILEALYRGQINPDETIVPSQPEYRAIYRQVAVQAQQWRERLGEEAFRSWSNTSICGTGQTVCMWKQPFTMVYAWCEPAD